MLTIDWSKLNKLSDKEVRRRQSLCEKQIAIAFEQKNDIALARLREMENALMATMQRRCS